MKIHCSLLCSRYPWDAHRIFSCSKLMMATYGRRIGFARKAQVDPIRLHK